MNNHRSTSSFIFDVVGSLIVWFSKKQTMVATSSVETKYIMSMNTIKEAMWLHTLLIELNFSLTQAIVIYVDNLGCIALANNPVFHSWAKYINIKHYFIHEKIECQEIKLDYIFTKNMLIDVFTKALFKETFEKFCAQLGILLPEWCQWANSWARIKPTTLY